MTLTGVINRNVLPSILGDLNGLIRSSEYPYLLPTVHAKYSQWWSLMVLSVFL